MYQLKSVLSLTIKIKVFIVSGFIKKTEWPIAHRHRKELSYLVFRCFDSVLQLPVSWLSLIFMVVLCTNQAAKFQIPPSLKAHLIQWRTYYQWQRQLYTANKQIGVFGNLPTRSMNICSGPSRLYWYCRLLNVGILVMWYSFNHGFTITIKH